MTYPLPNKYHEVVDDIEQLGQTITQIDTDILNLEAKTVATSESFRVAGDKIIHFNQIMNGEITNIAPNRFLIVNNDGNGFTCVDGGGTSGGKTGQCTIKRTDEDYDTIYGDIWNVSRNGTIPQMNSENGCANCLDIFCDESEIENAEQFPKVNSKTIQATQDFEVESNSSVIFKDTLEETNEPIELATNQNYGLIKVGTGIDVSNGTISADIITTADKNQFGYVKVGSGIDIEEGVISVAEIDAATKEKKGVVKVGADFELNENGEMELLDMTDAFIIYKLDQIKNCENGNVDLEEGKLIYRLVIKSDLVIQINENFVPIQDYTFILELISDGTHLVAFLDQFKDGMTELPINRGITKLKISKKLGVPYYEAVISRLDASAPVLLTSLDDFCSKFLVTAPKGGSWQGKSLCKNSYDGFCTITELNYEFFTLVCVDYVNYLCRSSSVAMNKFIFEGSNDNKNWTTLIHKENQVCYGKNYTERKGCFRYYKLSIGYSGDDNKPGGVMLFGTEIDNNECEITNLTPYMASNITPYATLTASSTPSGSAANITDGDMSTYMRVTSVNGSRWIKYELTEPAVANMLELNFSAANNQTNWFKLEGSNDDENWELLLERQYPTNTLFNNGVRVVFYHMANETAYKYYKLTCLATNDSSDNWDIIGFKLFFVNQENGKHNFHSIAPKLSSNSQDGYETTADSLWSGSQAFHAFDGNVDSSWASSQANTHWLQIKLPEASVSTVAQIISRSDGYLSQHPKDFEIQGSNDGETWDTLTSQTGILWSSTSQSKEFNFENETAYQYYRLWVTATDGQTVCSLGEFLLGNKTLEYKRYLDKYDYLVPKMSSNSQNGYIASASRESYGQKLYAAFEAFNREISDRSSWGTTVKPAWLQIELPEAKKANILKVSGAFSGEEPTSFTLYGSNNGTNWTTLLSSGTLTWTHNETKTWELSGNTAYKYYRLGDINSKNSWVDIAEFQLIYKDLIQEY